MSTPVELIARLITAPIQMAVDFFDRRAERKSEEHKLKMSNSHTWNLAQIANSGWKDEYWTIVLSIPMVGAFVPPAVPVIQQGFLVLDGLPEYYKMFLGTAIAAAFGFQQLTNVINKVKGFGK